MADISKDDLRKEITSILKSANLETTSAKKVRQQIEEKLDVDLTERKKEIDELVMEYVQEKTDSKKGKKGKAASEESEDGEEEEEEASEEEEEEEEKKPAKRGPKKGSKRKKGSSDDEESASEEDVSDEDYKPKKAKGSPKKAKAKKGAAKGKKGADDSDSDSDWGKNKKAAPAKKGAKKGGGGYTRAINLSPELAAIVGAEQLPRHEVVKKVWAIIKERNLYDPKNKQFAICDEELFKVIGVKRFRTFGMMKYLKNHFVD